MELLERALLPWMHRRELASGQGEAACGGDAWPQRTGPPALRTASRRRQAGEAGERCSQGVTMLIRRHLKG